MKIIYTNKFERAYKKLPNTIKILAKERESFFRKDPYHPLLKTHKLTGPLKGLWSFSIDFHHRIVFELGGKDEVYFHMVGTHAIYR